VRRNYAFEVENGVPIRINPVQKLPPCLLTLESIEGICSRVTRDFPDAAFSAEDGPWEIYDEDAAQFLAEVSKRDELQDFVVCGITTQPARRLEMIFNEEEATVKLQADVDQLDWFEHFLIDIQKFLLKPITSQLLPRRGQIGSLPLPYFLMLTSSLFELYLAGVRAKYCRILIRKKPPNPMAENIKANLISNLIWLILGISFTLLGVWLWRELSIDITPWDG
jgi:hypothetical protein